MDRELKAKWCEALRSGDFTQGRKKLKHAGRFCCLGVLQAIEPQTAGAYDGGGAKCDYYKPFNRIGLDSKTQEHLMEMNDASGRKRFTFEDIADWIEQNL